MSKDCEKLYDIQIKFILERVKARKKLFYFVKFLYNLDQVKNLRKMRKEIDNKEINFLIYLKEKKGVDINEK